LQWKDAEHTPFAVQFTQGNETLEVDIVDLRPPADFAATPLPEVDPNLSRALREAFLLQRYGGPAVEPDPIPVLGGDRRTPEIAPPAADYSVQDWVEARAAFHVVDRWRAALKETVEDPALRERVRLDGKELRELFARRVGPASRLVAEELSWHLDEET
jgi:hypothetical protein